MFLSGTWINLLYQNLLVITEIPTFFYIRDYIRDEIKSQYWRNSVSALIASVVGTSIAAPLDFLHTRVVYRSLNVR